MHQFNYEQMALMANTTPDNFLNQSKRYEQQLYNDGWRFTKVGKGKKAIYSVEDDVYKKPWEEMTFKERFVEVTGLKCPYPIITRQYLNLLYKQPERAKFMTDRELAELFNCNLKTMNKIRNFLIKNDFLHKIKGFNKNDCQLWLIGIEKRNFERKLLTIEQYNEFWVIFYEIYKYKILDALNIDITVDEVSELHVSRKTKSKAKQSAFPEFENAIGGKILKIQPRITTFRFLELMDAFENKRVS